MSDLNPLDHPICFAIPHRLTSINSWHGHIPFAMFLVDILKPKTIVELGTHNGDSYCAFCQAVKELNLDTRCYAIDTWQGDPQTGFYGPEVLADLRSYHDPLYGSFSRLIQSTFDEALSHFSNRTIDLLHIDGLHTYEAIKHDFESWLPKMSPSGVILLHNINVLELDYGISKFWGEVKLKYPHFEFLHGDGFGILSIDKIYSRDLYFLLNAKPEETTKIRDLFFKLGNYLIEKISNGNKDQIIWQYVEEIKKKSEQITELNKSLQALNNQIYQLQTQLEQIQHGIPMQIRNKYQRVIENLLKQGTRRRRYYQLGIKGVRIILNEGWRSFFRKAKNKARKKRIQINKQIKNLPQLETSDKKLKLMVKNLSFPDSSAKPEVSIIIPAYNKWKYTVNCLKSIRDNTEGDYEVVVVNDASTDETFKILSPIKNLHFVSNEKNSGFVDTCNHGAKVSKGNYLLFLNNDTMVTKNWLSSLLEIIKKEDVGGVGSKLIYPDGTLQEAGSIVWRDGSALGYGRGDDPEKPEYNYVKEVDYCTGACLLVQKELFENIGGFDIRFRPGYYEETDLCFSIRNLGYKIMYQPRSVVIHFEGITNGIDISSGVKKYQEINKPKFAEKWNFILNKQYPKPTPEYILLARNRLPGDKILIIDDRIPVPSQGAGFPRAFSMLKMIAELGYQVTFFPYDNPTPWEPYTNEFQQMGIEIFYGNNLNFVKFAENRPDYYELVLISRPHNMKTIYETVKKCFPKAIILYDAEAMFSLREILKAKVKGIILKKEDTEWMINDEINLMKKADLIITVSENEKKIILDRTKINNIAVWGHAINIKNPQTPFRERKDILFVGGFLGTDSPNEDAILYFVREIFPKIEKELSCRLFIVGNNPPDSVKRLSSSSIIVTGYVKDLREYYEKCRIFIVPHKYSAGIPLKLLEAMSYGIPSVVSQLTASQLDLVDRNETLIAQNTEEFIQKVIDLYQHEQLWLQIQNNGLNYIKETCDTKSLKIKLNQILQSANYKY